MSNLSVRRINADEGETWRTVRLAMIQDTPSAYGETADEVGAKSVAEMSDYARSSSAGAQRCTFFAYLGAECVGSSAGVISDGVPHVFGMWVHPSFRNRGIGKAVLEAVETWASDEVGSSQIELVVIDDNTGAQAVYERCGYTFDGRSKPSTHYPERRWLFMVKTLVTPNDE